MSTGSRSTVIAVHWPGALKQKTRQEMTWRAMLAVTRGGLVPAMIVARELGIREIDTISIKCYDHQDIGEPVVLKPGNLDVLGDGERILVIDDLVDTGCHHASGQENLPQGNVLLGLCQTSWSPPGRCLCHRSQSGHVDLLSMGHCHCSMPSPTALHDQV